MCSRSRMKPQTLDVLDAYVGPSYSQRWESRAETGCTGRWPIRIDLDASPLFSIKCSFVSGTLGGTSFMLNRDSWSRMVRPCGQLRGDARG